MYSSSNSNVAILFDPASMTMRDHHQAAPVVQHEERWRSLIAYDPTLHGPVVAALWDDRNTSMKESEVVISDDVFIVSVFLRPARIELEIDFQKIHVGSVAAGSFYVSYPGQKIKNVFFGACKCLSIYISGEFMRTALGGGALSRQRGFPSAIQKDVVIEQLAKTLLSADAGCCGSKCAERISMPLVSRLSHLLKSDAATSDKGKRIALPNWRVERVFAHIRNNISLPITLADMAQVASLSPMHFAAQFKATTGYRPHDYLLMCRIDRAKELLADTNISLIDVALDVGFRTQAHFSTVFKRLTGYTPNAWRVMLK